jgi:hypothetical protein
MWECAYLLVQKPVKRGRGERRWRRTRPLSRARARAAGGRRRGSGADAPPSPRPACPRVRRSHCALFFRHDSCFFLRARGLCAAAGRHGTSGVNRGGGWCIGRWTALLESAAAAYARSRATANRRRARQTQTRSPARTSPPKQTHHKGRTRTNPSPPRIPLVASRAPPATVAADHRLVGAPPHPTCRASPSRLFVWVRRPSNAPPRRRRAAPRRKNGYDGALPSARRGPRAAPAAAAVRARRRRGRAARPAPAAAVDGLVVGPAARPPADAVGAVPAVLAV